MIPTEQLIADGKISINKERGVITYNTGLTSENSPKGFNIMSTPKGGQYRLVLPDGSKVWLNSASSLKYPTVFNGKERIVELIGEGYFEIKENKAKPFIVKADKEEIRVLGTQFNVNAYPDEPSQKTSLLEGSVKIHDKILKPGQAFLNGKIVFTDLQKDIAWKNGVFNFNDATVEEAMRRDFAVV